MKKASITGLPSSPRPSSVRRIRNLRALIEAFAERDIGCAAAALLLSCSLSAARNYIVELLDAGVLVAHPVKQGARCLDRTLYQLAADRRVQQRFLATLDESENAGFSFGPCNPPARRDPLVAALFGMPDLDAEPREPVAPVKNVSRIRLSEESSLAVRTGHVVKKVADLALAAPG